MIEKGDHIRGVINEQHVSGDVFEQYYCKGAKINRGHKVPVLSEKLRCMERHRETQVNMTTFAKTRR
jgi:hypothetical protein